MLSSYAEPRFPFVWFVNWAAFFCTRSNAFICPPLHGSQYADPYSRLGLPMACRLNFLYTCFLFWENALQSAVPSRLFALCNLLGPPSLNRFVRLFPRIYNCSLPEFLVTKRVNKWIFNPSSRKSYCLPFTGIYFHPIFYCPFPQGVQILLQLFCVIHICDFFYVLYSSQRRV